jgi:hypothetical protein
VSRVANVGIVAQIDLGPAKTEFERWVKDVQSKGLSVPLSVAPGGGPPTSTLSGVSVGAFSPTAATTGLASQNIGLHFGRLEQSLASLTAAITGLGHTLTPTSSPNYSYLMGAGGGPGGGAPGAGASSPNWSYYFGQIQQQMQAAMPTSSPNWSYFASLAAGQGNAPGPNPNPAPPGRGGGANPFRRLISQVAGGYAVYHAAHAALQYGVNRQIEGVYESEGDQAGLLAAQQSTYQNTVSSLGPVGTAYDLFTGGSASIVRDNLQIKQGQLAEQSNVRRLGYGVDAGIERAGFARSAASASVRNEFDRQQLEISNSVASRADQVEADIQKRQYENSLITNTHTRFIANNELKDYAKTQRGLVSDYDLSTLPQRDEIERSRRFAQQGRDIGYATSISQNSYIAANDRVGASLAGIYGQTRGQINGALGAGNPQDVGKIIAVGLSEAFTELAQTKRTLTAEALGLQGSAAVSALQLGRDPLTAQLRGIENTRQGQLGALPTGTIFDLLGGSAVRAGINANADAQGALANQRYLDQDKFIGIAQNTRNRQIDALLRRDAVGADVAGIVGNTQAQALSYRNAGQYDRAIDQLSLGGRELDLTRQNYLEGFHAVQIGQNQDTSNPRGGDTVAETLKKIADGQQELIQALKDLASD